MAALAEEHGLGPALWGAVAANRAVPAGVADELRRSHRSNTGRSMVLRRELEAVVAALAARGVEVLALKGAGYLATSELGEVGIREMGDLDLAVRPRDVDAAQGALSDAGYTAVERPYGLVHHDLIYVSPHALAPVELHTAMGDPRVDACLPLEDVWARSRPVAMRGDVARIPSVEDSLVHNVLHAQVQDREHAYLGVPLRQLHTFVLGARAWTTAVDWATVDRRLTGMGHRPSWLAHLELARRIFGPDGLPDVALTWRTRAHTEAALSSFALAWPTDVARNLQYALDRQYLEARYGPLGSRRRLMSTRARHLLHVWRSDGAGALDQARSARR